MPGLEDKRAWLSKLGVTVLSSHAAPKGGGVMATGSAASGGEMPEEPPTTSPPPEPAASEAVASEEQSPGGASAADGDASSALPVMAAMGAAVPLPVPDPEGPVSGIRLIEKGVEQGGKAVGGALAGVAVAPILVGIAAGAAVLTWSSKTAPPWMDEMNPETGQPYKSEDEWKAVKQRRATQQRGGGRQPDPGPLVAPDDPDAPPQTPSCQTLFPGIPICITSRDGYGSMEEAAKAQPEYEQAVRQNVTTMSEYQGIPGGENSHATYYDSSGNKLFTLINRPCCQDTDAGPVLQWSWVVA